MITVAVTAEDIRDGKKCSCRHCPIALAVGRVFGNSREITVFRGTLTLWVDTLTMYRHFRHNGADFIKAFDWGGEVEPTTVTLEEVPC